MDLTQKVLGLSDEQVQDFKEYIADYLSATNGFIDDHNYQEFEKIAFFWLALPYAMNSYHVYYDDHLLDIDSCYIGLDDTDNKFDNNRVATVLLQWRDYNGVYIDVLEPNYQYVEDDEKTYLLAPEIDIKHLIDNIAIIPKDLEEVNPRILMEDLYKKACN